MSMIKSQWKGKRPENKTQRDTVGENSNHTFVDENGVVEDHQSTISHSATLISHPDYSLPKRAVNGPLTCNDESPLDTPPDSPSGTARPGDDESERHEARARTPTAVNDSSNSPPQNQRWPKIVIPQKILSRIAVELENTGSTARDHLANERTWLAYVRTSLAIAGTGVALVQLFTISIGQEEGSRRTDGSALQRAARPLGATTVMAGVLVLCVGIYRYFFVQISLMQNKFPVARTAVIAISVIIAALAAVLFGLLIGLKD